MRDLPGVIEHCHEIGLRMYHTNWRCCTLEYDSELWRCCTLEYDSELWRCCTLEYDSV